MRVPRQSDEQAEDKPWMVNAKEHLAVLPESSVAMYVILYVEPAKNVEPDQ